LLPLPATSLLKLFQPLDDSTSAPLPPINVSP